VSVDPCWWDRFLWVWEQTPKAGFVLCSLNICAMTICMKLAKLWIFRKLSFISFSWYWSYFV
jgi:hypothetical protein